MEYFENSEEIVIGEPRWTRALSIFVYLLFLLFAVTVLLPPKLFIQPIELARFTNWVAKENTRAELSIFVMAVLGIGIGFQIKALVWGDKIRFVKKSRMITKNSKKIAGFDEIVKISVKRSLYGGRTAIFGLYLYFENGRKRAISYGSKKKLSDYRDRIVLNLHLKV
jgi:hypothetical protein